MLGQQPDPPSNHQSVVRPSSLQTRPVRSAVPAITGSPALAPPAVASSTMSSAKPGPNGLPRSVRLSSGWYNPMPGGIMAGYRADTGLDIAGFYRPVYALAAGKIDYAEGGHSLWDGSGNSPYSVRIELDHPVMYRGKRVTHLWYAHLSKLQRTHAEGDRPRPRVRGGELLGISGAANGSPHLHLGLLLDGEVSQAWGTYLLASEIRDLLGGYRRGLQLPRK